MRKGLSWYFNATFTFIVFLFLGVTAYAGVFFSDSFETGGKTHSENGVSWKSSANVTVSTSKAHNGKYALRFHYIAKPAGQDATAEQRFYLGSPKKDLYVRFYINFPSNFKIREYPANNKMIVVWGNTYSDVETQSQEYDLYNFMPRAKKRAVGDSFILSYDPSARHGDVSKIQGLGAWSFKNLQLGKWYCFEYHFKPDTGSGNGAMEFWVDGVKKYGKTGIKWESAPPPNQFFLNGYLMGWANSGFDENTDIYIDDVVFSDSYIGPGAGSSSSSSSSASTSVPPPPTNIKVTY